MSLTHFTDEQLNEELTKRKASVEEVERVIESRKEWPQDRDKVFAIGIDGTVGKFPYDSCDPYQEKIKNFLGIYRDEASAQIVLELVKALVPANKFIPKHGEEFWVWEKTFALSMCRTVELGTYEKFHLTIGNIHRTKEDCEAYGSALTKAAEQILK